MIGWLFIGTMLLAGFFHWSFLGILVLFIALNYRAQDA